MSWKSRIERQARRGWLRRSDKEEKQFARWRSGQLPCTFHHRNGKFWQIEEHGRGLIHKGRKP